MVEFGLLLFKSVLQSARRGERHVSCFSRRCVVLQCGTLPDYVPIPHHALEPELLLRISSRPGLRVTLCTLFFYPLHRGAGAKPLLAQKNENLWVVLAQELKVIADFYDFMLWLIKHIEKFPRHHRYSLGISIENRLQRLLGLLLRAKYSYNLISEGKK